jgi:hypothetical protein
MGLTLFSCHHAAPDHVADTPLFRTLLSGLRAPGACSDLEGDNIAGREKFCELRHQYHVWRHRAHASDHLGFEHYRRALLIDPAADPLLAEARAHCAAGAAYAAMPVSARAAHQAMRRAFTADQRAAVERAIGGHDILFVEAIHAPVDAQFKANHAGAAALWDCFAARLDAHWGLVFPRRHLAFPAAWSGYRNMVVMRSEFFCEYMALIMPVLLAMDDEFPDAPARIWGHLSERALGAYIMHKRMERPLLRVRQWPYLLFDQPD